MEMEHYNPMNDVLFKFVFGKEERKHITIKIGGRIEGWNRL